MKRFLPTLLVLGLASCAGSPAPPSADRVRIAIAGIASREGVGSLGLAESATEHLQDLLFASRRFEIAERRHLHHVIGEKEELAYDKAGALAGVDLVVYGMITREKGDVYVHVRVVRVNSGVIAYSGSRLIGSTDEVSSKNTVRTAIEELVGEITMRLP